jgi:hypothetical protein
MLSAILSALAWSSAQRFICASVLYGYFFADIKNAFRVALGDNTVMGTGKKGSAIVSVTRTTLKASYVTHKFLNVVVTATAFRLVAPPKPRYGYIAEWGCLISIIIGFRDCNITLQHNDQLCTVGRRIRVLFCRQTRQYRFRRKGNSFLYWCPSR